MYIFFIIFLCRSFCFVLFCFVLFCFVLFCFVLFCFFFVFFSLIIQLQLSMPALHWLCIKILYMQNCCFTVVYLDLLHIVAACFAGHAVMHAHFNMCH